MIGSLKLQSDRARGWRVIVEMENDVLTMHALRAMPADVTAARAHLNHKSSIQIRTKDIEIIEEMLWTMAEDIANRVPRLVARQVYRLAAKLEDEIQSP